MIKKIIPKAFRVYWGDQVYYCLVKLESIKDVDNNSTENTWFILLLDNKYNQIDEYKQNAESAHLAVRLVIRDRFNIEDLSLVIIHKVNAIEIIKSAVNKEGMNNGLQYYCVQSNINIITLSMLLDFNGEDLLIYVPILDKYIHCYFEIGQDGKRRGSYDVYHRHDMRWSFGYHVIGDKMFTILDIAIDNINEMLGTNITPFTPLRKVVGKEKEKVLNKSLENKDIHRIKNM